MIDIIAYNRELDAVGVVDTETSLIWERRFYEAGYFEIHTPATENNNELLKQGYFLLCADALESGFIQYIHKETDGEGNSDITAVGRFLSYLLHGHIVRSAQTYEGNAEEIMRGLVYDTVINTAGADLIDGLVLGELCNTTVTAKARIEYADLHDALKEIACISGVGFRIRLDPNTKQLVFECFEGRDHSAGQYDNPQVVFSSEYDTILGSAGYTEDDSVTVDAVTMRYSGELGEVVVRYAPEEKTGIDLHEIAVTTDKCVSYTVEGVTYLNRSATEQLLRAEARKYITAKAVNVTASVSHSGSYVYKEDYDIGDIITVQYPPYGIELTRRIHRIAENYTENGLEIIPDMGEIMPKGADI